MAMDKPKNVPIPSPMIELYSVPQIAGSRPKSSRFVSQVVDVSRLNPNRTTAGLAVQLICKTMYVPSAMIAHASALVPARMTRSVRISLELGGRAIDAGALGRGSSSGADDMTYCRAT